MATTFYDSNDTVMAVGARVFCFDLNEQGSVVQLQTLGLPFAPTVLTDGGMRKLYCGTSLPEVCPYVPAFLQAMEQLGYAPDDVEGFKKAWRAGTPSASHRRRLADGLETARAAGEVPQYLSTVKTELGV